MTVPPGTRFGPYEVTGPLGAGSMGEVYRARDERIGRSVAIKILPRGFAEDEDHVRRFEQEARAAGMLNHPNLLTIFDLGTQDGSTYIVSEFLDGMTLRERLQSQSTLETFGSANAPRTIPLGEAVELARQIATGLGAAHEQGLVHRDLKPDNIFITRDNRVKILDFGLAKVSGTDRSMIGSGSGSGSGTIVGTPGYMAPEQIRGLPVDARADIFSFGAILFEMLSGQQAFVGDSPIETLMVTLREDPDVTALQTVSPAFASVVKRCLQRDPSSRFQSAYDIAFAIEALYQKAPSQDVGAPATVRSKLPTFRRITFRRGYVMSARFAPDGSILYGATWDGAPMELFSARPGSPESRPFGLPGADILAVQPSGELAVGLDRHFIIGFASSSTLARVPLSGGTPREILEDVQDAEWAPDGKSFILARRLGEQYRLEYPRGTVLYESSGWISNPRLSHDGKQIAFLDHPIWGDDGARVVSVDLQGNVTRTSRLWPSTGGVAWHPETRDVWVAGDVDGFSRDLFAIDGEGNEHAMLNVPGRLSLHDIGRDGRGVITFDTARREIVALDTTTGKEKNLSWLDWSFLGDLSADGKRIVFEEQLANGNGIPSIYVRPTDGSPAVLVGEGRSRAFTPDGKWILTVPPGPFEHFVLMPIGAGEPKVVPCEGLERVQAWLIAAGGQTIVLWASEKGRGVRLYAMPYPDGKPVPISPEGVTIPIISSPDGREVLALSPENIPMRYAIDGSGEQAIPGALPGDMPLQWSGSTVYVCKNSGAQSAITALDLETGERQLWRTIAPPDPAGVLDPSPIMATRDMSLIVFSYRRLLSDVYVVEGL